MHDISTGGRQLLTDQLPDLVRRRVEAGLLLGETVVWCGQPAPKRMALRCAVMPGCVLILLLFVVVVVSAVDWILRWWDIRSGFLTFVFWIACGVSSLAFLTVLAAPASAWWRALRTVYVITNRRAMVIVPEGKTYSYPAATMPTLLVHQLPDGSGEILFEYRETDNPEVSSRDAYVVGFLELADVDAPRRALEWLLGRDVSAEQVTTLSLNYYHPL